MDSFLSLKTACILWRGREKTEQVSKCLCTHLPCYHRHGYPDCLIRRIISVTGVTLMHVCFCKDALGRGYSGYMCHHRGYNWSGFDIRINQDVIKYF